MTASRSRRQDLLLALGATVLAVGGVAVAVLAGDALDPAADDSARVWLRAVALASTLAAALVGSGLLFGRRSSPGRQLVDAGVVFGVLTLAGVVLGGLLLGVDDRVDSGDAALLGTLAALPSLGALWFASGWLLRDP